MNDFFETDKTLEYYNTHAREFAGATVSVDFEEMQNRFLERLPENALILDFGCGAGRDTGYFLSRGFRVEAVDGSEELCHIASEYTGIPVKRMLFDELDAVDKYDGIWACSSLLHLPVYELAVVMHKMVRALKNSGIIYTSFKYGDSEGYRNGRYFTDMTEDKFEDFIKQIKGVSTEDMWVTADARPERGDEKWLNVILRKIRV